MILWNYRLGIVYAAVGTDTGPTSDGVPQIIEANITGPDPLADSLITPPPPPPPIVLPGSGGLSFAAPSPNPASDDLTLRFTLATPAEVMFDVFDTRGRRVARIAPGTMGAGPQTLRIPLVDGAGRRLPIGYYRVRMIAAGRALTRGFATVR